MHKLAVRLSISLSTNFLELESMPVGELLDLAEEVTEAYGRQRT